ncbi:hypothetical protein C8J57DRAFT_692728 [Mycena rebaudengoi]|nr:hypothetical protein C8J57DRAFT_692728 [Mycena rebaudengoi]
MHLNQQIHSAFLLPSFSSTSRPSPRRLSAVEKHKRRLKRYAAAEARLARLDDPSPSPNEIQADALRYASSGLAVHVSHARLGLRTILGAGRRDDARWMAERRLTTLESLQAHLSSKSVAEDKHDVTDSLRRYEANLVRFLGTCKGDGLVPVYTQARRHHPPRLTGGEVSRRYMSAQSPMQLHPSGPLPVAPSTRSDWPWDTRVRSILMYPTPLKRKTTPPLKIFTESPPPSARLSASSTGTGSSRSPTETETPLTEPDDDEDYRFPLATKPQSRVSYSPAPRWQTDTPLTEPDDDEDESEDESEVEYPIFKPQSRVSYTPKPRLQTRSAPVAPVAASSRRLPTPPTAGTGYSDRPLPTIRPGSSVQQPAMPEYTWLVDPSTWERESSWRGDGWEVSSSPPASSSASPTRSSSPSPTSTVHTDFQPPPTAAAASPSAAFGTPLLDARQPPPPPVHRRGHAPREAPPCEATPRQAPPGEATPCAAPALGALPTEEALPQLLLVFLASHAARAREPPGGRARVGAQEGERQEFGGVMDGLPARGLFCVHLGRTEDGRLRTPYWH